MPVGNAIRRNRRDNYNDAIVDAVIPLSGFDKQQTA